MSRRRILGRTIKGGTLGAIGGLSALELGGERDYNLLSDVYGDKGIYNARDRLKED